MGTGETQETETRRVDGAVARVDGAVAGLLRDPQFLRYLVGRILSGAGNVATLVALPVLVYRASDSASLTALVAACEAAPYLLFGLLAGALTDRWNRKRVIITADILSTVLLATIPLAHWVWGEVSIPHVSRWRSWVRPSESSSTAPCSERSPAGRPRPDRRRELLRLEPPERHRDRRPVRGRRADRVSPPGLAARLRRAHVRGVGGAAGRHHPPDARRRAGALGADRPPGAPRHWRGAGLPRPPHAACAR